MTSALSDPQRIVALGASNLTRGFHTVVATARALWGPDVEVLGALGHGRSYGQASSFSIRTLPGILESGLWDQLAKLPVAPTRSLITDVGNDVLFHCTPAQIIEWVEKCVDRLQRHTSDIVITDLPLHSVRRLSDWRFLFFRRMLAPKCRLSLAESIDISEQVVAGLEQLAARRGLRYFKLRDEWYGFDPIHMRHRYWRKAWQEILCGEVNPALRLKGGWLESIQLYRMHPERQWMMEKEQITPQHGLALKRGGKIWLY